MESSKPQRASWSDIQEEYRQLSEGVLERIRQRMGIRSDGQVWSFAQREALAEELSREIGSFLLEKSIVADSALPENTQPEKAECPHCHRLVSRAKDKEGKPRIETFFLKTKTGNIPVETALYECWKCRRAFSPYEDLSSSKRYSPQ